MCEEEKSICINMYDNWYSGRRPEIFWRYLVQLYFFTVWSAKMMFLIARVTNTHVRIIESINNEVQADDARKVVILRFNNLFKQALRVIGILITYMMLKLSSSRWSLQNISLSLHRLIFVRRERGNLYWFERKYLLLCFIFQLFMLA